MTGFCVWLTGLPSAGKTTLGIALQEILEGRGHDVVRLDGDEARKRWARDLGFSPEDRRENVRRIAVEAGRAVEENKVAVVSVIAPYRAMREESRRVIRNYVEVFVDCPLDVCEKRDVKGLYQKQKRGEITGLTGVDDPYEAPESPDLRLRTAEEDVETCLDKILRTLTRLGKLTG